MPSDTSETTPMNLFVQAGFICRRMHDKDNGPGIPLFELTRTCGEDAEFESAKRQIDDALAAAWNRRSAADPLAWQPISTAPSDESTLIRWHRIWKCEVAVQRNNGRIPGYPEWITATNDQTWPEDAFLPFWRRPMASPNAATMTAALPGVPVGYVPVPAEPTAGASNPLKAALKAAADYSPGGVPTTMQRAGMVTQAIRAYIGAASADAAAAAKLSDLLEEMAGELTRAHDLLGQFVREHSDPGTDAMASLWCMGRLLRRARAAGMLQGNSADRSTVGHFGQGVVDALNAVVQFTAGMEDLPGERTVSVALDADDDEPSGMDEPSPLTLAHLRALALTMKGDRL